MANASTLSNQDKDWRDDLTWYTYETSFIRVIKALGRYVFWPVLKVQCTGLENIPTGPCILASNHINNLDVVAIGLNMPRHPHFMAKIELYKNPFFAWFIRVGGSFPVNRGESDAWALRQAGRVLEAGQMVCMFPEGTRGKTAQLRKGKVGSVRLALEHQVPVIPMSILGTQNFDLRLKRHPVTIQVGKPMDFTALAGPPPHDYQQLRELTTVLMKQIASMLPPEYWGVYA